MVRASNGKRSDDANFPEGIDGLLSTCLMVPCIMSTVRNCPPNMKGLPLHLIEKEILEIVDWLNVFFREYGRRRDMFLSSLAGVRAPDIAKWGGFSESCFAEITHAAATEIYNWLVPIGDVRFAEYLDSGGGPVPPELQSSEVWSHFREARLSLTQAGDCYIPRRLNRASMGDPDELAAYVRQEFLLAKRSLGDTTSNSSGCVSSSSNHGTHPTQSFPDGPTPKNIFAKAGKTVELQPLPWKLANCLWTKFNRTASRDVVAREVWGEDDVTIGQLGGARDRFNSACESAGVAASISVNTTTGFVSLEA